MKICSECKYVRPTNDFGPHSTSLDKLQYVCRECLNKRGKKRRKTKEGLVQSIYNKQTAYSKKSGYPKPTYTRKELEKWMLSQKLFTDLYDDWVSRNYLVDYTPTIDRKNDYKGYSFSNIQIMTWQDNRAKCCADSINGINNKRSNQVIQMDEDGKHIATFYSAGDAGRKTGISRSSISVACRNNRSSCGFRWEYLDA